MCVDIMYLTIRQKVTCYVDHEYSTFQVCSGVTFDLTVVQEKISQDESEDSHDVLHTFVHFSDFTPNFPFFFEKYCIVLHIQA